jgi:glutamate synthase domain-containing protein 3
VSGPGVGTIAVGVAKAHADVVVISGSGGGTGASPLLSMKHAGSPWEFGLAEAHQSLVASGLRGRVVLETDGSLRTGRDVVFAALLGADRFGFGTLPLLALGCKMVRQCHENTCPVGIATQDEDLRAKYTGSVEQVIALFRLIAEDVREHLAALGARTLDQIIGRADLLQQRTPGDRVSDGFSRLLARADMGADRSFRILAPSPLGERLAALAGEAMTAEETIQVSYPVSNTDRSIGTRLSGEIAEQRGDAGLEEGAISIRLSGTAGQSLGAFLARGVAISVEGTGNDYVGKGMGGGLLVIRPSVTGHGIAAHGAGNACLYGATGGKLFISGTVGQRFAVRNSGAVAVVEGTSDHACEYMTGGTVAILGPVGRNVAAGMTGGLLFVWDPTHNAKGFFADTAPGAVRPTDPDAGILRALLEEHAGQTGSTIAREILDEWDRERERFWILRPASPQAVGRRERQDADRPVWIG